MGSNLIYLNDAEALPIRQFIPRHAGDVGEGKQDVCVEEGLETTAKAMPKGVTVVCLTERSTNGLGLI